MPFSGPWPRSGTMSSGRVYARPMSAPRTGGNGSSSWPTPDGSVFNDGGDPAVFEARRARLKELRVNGNSDAHGIVDEKAAALSHTPENKERAQLYRRVATLYTNQESPTWPTPRHRRGPSYRPQSDGRVGLSLDGRAENWPTPRAQERGQQNGYAGPDRAVALSRAAAFWPTPIASEDRKAGREGDERRDATLTEKARQWRTPRAVYGDHSGMEDQNHLTGQALTLYPTPDVGSVTKFSLVGRGQRSKGLEAMARRGELWMTPTGRDNKDGAAEGSSPTNSLLSRQAPRSGLRAPTSATSGGGSSGPGPTSRPRLSPRFVEWLMGLPIGWTDLGP